MSTWEKLRTIRATLAEADMHLTRAQAFSFAAESGRGTTEPEAVEAHLESAALLVEAVGHAIEEAQRPEKERG